MYDYQKVDNFIEFGFEISQQKSREEAFEILTTEIEKVEPQYINDFIQALNYLQNEGILDWIEQNSFRIVNISQNWGQLAASSKFTWKRAEKWLDNGRPLSLIALDALVFCTTKGERQNQSLWMRKLNPQLTDNENIEIIAKRLSEYKTVDKAPRVRFSVEKIISNLYN